MDPVTLAPEQEDFTREAIASGRYRDVADVVGAAVSLLRRVEVERASFIASLEAAQVEGERSGFFNAEDVGRELDAIIDAAERRTA